MGAKQRRRIASKARKALKKKYGSYKKARRATGIKSASALRAYSAQNLITPIGTNAFAEAQESYVKQQRRRAEIAQKETTQKINERIRVQNNKIKAKNTYNQLMNIRRTRKRKENQENWEKNTEGYTTGEIFDLIKQQNPELPSGTTIATIKQETKPIIFNKKNYDEEVKKEIDKLQNEINISHKNKRWFNMGSYYPDTNNIEIDERQHLNPYVDTTNPLYAPLSLLKKIIFSNRDDTLNHEIGHYLYDEKNKIPYNITRPMAVSEKDKLNITKTYGEPVFFREITKEDGKKSKIYRAPETTIYPNVTETKYKPILNETELKEVSKNTFKNLLLKADYPKELIPEERFANEFVNYQKNPAQFKKNNPEITEYYEKMLGIYKKNNNNIEKTIITPGFTGTTGDNISTIPKNVQEEKNENLIKTINIRNDVSNDKPVDFQNILRNINVPTSNNNKNKYKPSSKQRMELVEKYYSELPQRAIDSLFYRDFGTDPEEVLGRANDKKFGQEKKPETKIAGSFLTGYVKIPKELYDENLSKSENVDKLYEDVKNYYSTKNIPLDNRVPASETTVEDRKKAREAFYMAMGTLPLTGSNIALQTGKGLLLTQSVDRAVGNSLSPEKLIEYADTLDNNYHGKDSWFEKGIRGTAYLGNKAQQGFTYLEDNFDPTTTTNTAEQITNWGPYIVGSMGNYAVEKPLTFGLGQNTFKKGIQSISAGLNTLGKKIKISPRMANLLARGTGDALDVGGDLIDILPQTPKEAWIPTTLGITATNYALDRGIDIKKIKPQQALTIVQAPFKEYHPGWSLDPSGSFTSLSDKKEFLPHEQVLNPETPLRLREEYIDQLKKATFTGKDPALVTLPQRTNFEKKIISFGEKNQEAILKGSRSFYAQANKPIKYSQYKDADYAFSENIDLSEMSEKANKHFFNGQGKITSFETDIGTVYNIKSGKEEIELTNDKIPFVTIKNNIKLSEPNHEIKKKWFTSTEFKKTIRRGREKDLPKLEEALNIYSHDLKINPLTKEDIFIHAGNLPKFRSFTPKIKTPTAIESTYGENLHPILYGGQNEMISFFRKGGLDTLRLHQNKDLKFLRGKDLPKKFTKPQGNKEQRIKIIKEYLEWLKKSYPDGVVAPSAHTVGGIDFKGKITKNVEKEWIYYGKLPKIKHTGFGFDPIAKYTNEFPLVNIVSNKQFPEKKIYKRLLKPLKNIKNIFTDINKQNEFEKNIFLQAKKIKENIKQKESSLPKKEQKLNEFEQMEKDIKENKGIFAQPSIFENSKKLTKKELKELEKSFNEGLSVDEELWLGELNDDLVDSIAEFGGPDIKYKSSLPKKEQTKNLPKTTKKEQGLFFTKNADGTLTTTKNVDAKEANTLSYEDFLKIPRAELIAQDKHISDEVLRKRKQEAKVTAAIAEQKLRIEQLKIKKAQQITNNNQLVNKKTTLSKKDKEILKLDKQIRKYYDKKLSEAYKYLNKISEKYGALNKTPRYDYYDSLKRTYDITTRKTPYYETPTEYSITEEYPYDNYNPTYRTTNPQRPRYSRDSRIKRPEQTKNPTRIVLPGKTTNTNKLKVRSKEQNNIYDGYAPVFIKGKFKKQGRTFATKEMAEWEGMELVDENPITDYKIERVKTNKEALKRKRPQNSLTHKFKTLHNGVRREKRYYGFDKKGERKGSFNMYPYLGSRS